MPCSDGLPIEECLASGLESAKRSLELLLKDLKEGVLDVNQVFTMFKELGRGILEDSETWAENHKSELNLEVKERGN